MYSIDDVAKADKDIADLIEAELARQNSHIELIASENWVSKAVMAAMGSPLTNKYAEGYTGKRFYGGCSCVDKGKILLKENTQELLDRAYHISGHEDLVKAARQQAQIYHEEHIGRSMGATVLLQPGQELEASVELRIQKPNLQKLFVAFCGEE